MPLDLNEKISIPLTREEWAVVIFGLASVNHAPPIDVIAETLCDKIQFCAAPLGVLVRVLAKARGE